MPYLHPQDLYHSSFSFSFSSSSYFSVYYLVVPSTYIPIFYLIVSTTTKPDDHSVSSPPPSRPVSSASSAMGASQPSGGRRSSTPAPSASDPTVIEALEIARDSPEGESDPTVRAILEGVLARTWGKVLAQPNSYVMTRDEFAIFNFYQDRFRGNKVAIAARKRYWDYTWA